MLVTCPQCQFARELPEDKIPARAQVATCPKCKHKFRFRELPPEEAAPDQEIPAPPPPAPDQLLPEGDIWDRLGAAAPEERPGQAPADNPFAADPDQPQVDVPFERLDQFGFFPGLYQTLRRILFNPQLFFEAMPLRGLGSIKVKERAARKGRNPRTGEEVAVPAKRTVKLLPGKALREALNERRFGRG